MRLTNLVEADLSRRQFLKLGGQAAMAAAAPKTALKGFMSRSKAVPQTSMIPKTPKAMRAALLKWVKDNNLEQQWRNKIRKQFANYEGVATGRSVSGRPEVIPKNQYNTPQGQAALKRAEDISIEQDYEEVMSFADPGRDEGSIEDLQHVLNNFENDDIFGAPLPAWVTRYRVSQWMGRDVGMDHPFVKDREYWLKHFYSGVYSKPDLTAEKQFDEIIRSSLSPARYKQMYDEDDVEAPEEDEGFTQADYDKSVRDKKEFQGSDYSSGNWRTQSVEFEARLHRLL